MMCRLLGTCKVDHICRHLYELPCTWNYHTWQCRPDGTENPPIERQKTGLNMCPGSSYCIIQPWYYPVLCRGCLWWHITTPWELWGIHLCWWSLAKGSILLLEGGQSGGEEYQHGGQGDQEGGGGHHSQVNYNIKKENICCIFQATVFQDLCSSSSYGGYYDC